MFEIRKGVVVLTKCLCPSSFRWMCNFTEQGCSHCLNPRLDADSFRYLGFPDFVQQYLRNNQLMELM